MKKYIFLLLFILSTSLLNAQSLKKANHLFNMRAYSAAANIFEKIEPKSQEIIEHLADCYFYNNKMKAASKWYQQLFKNYESTTSPQYLFNYSQALKGINKYTESDIWYQKYLKASHKKPTFTNTLKSLEFEQSHQITYQLKKIDGNSEYADFGPAFFGNKIVFASSRDSGKKYEWNNEPYLDLFVASTDNDGNFKTISSLSSINTKMHESNAVFTKDGKTMYFTRNNFIHGKKQTDENKISHLKIYKAVLVDEKWTNIKELPFNSNNYSVEHPSLNNTEDKLYFSSDMPGSLGSFDIFEVDINKDGSFGTPKNLGPKINTPHREQFPFISDKNILYYASDGLLSYGGLDIFRSKLDNGIFETPKNLGKPINSNADDFGLIIKNHKGYFSSNRKGGIGSDDVYAFNETIHYFVTGLVVDKKSKKKLKNVTVSLFNENGELINKKDLATNSSFKFEVKNGKNYQINANKNQYIPYKNYFTIKENDLNKTLDILMESYESAEKNIVNSNNQLQIKVNPIYFDFDKWNIKTVAAVELQHVVEILKKYEHLKIEIGAHTDFRGSDAYNLILSDKRANSVKKYLEKQGINSDRITAKGYGESKPINNCTKPGSCTEEGYDKNRRCEFIIIN
ncbi:MAG: OmpA family protein [Lutibacter sp.]